MLTHLLKVLIQNNKKILNRPLNRDIINSAFQMCMHFATDFDIISYFYFVFPYYIFVFFLN